MKARLIEPQDMEELARWAASSEMVQVTDLEDVTRNRTAQTMVITDDDGKVICYTPFYVTTRLGFTQFNPDTDDREKVEGVGKLLAALVEFSDAHGIDDIFDFTVPECRLKHWCLKNGFVEETRTAIVHKGPGKGK